MKLFATNCEFDGSRIWIENETKAKKFDYKVENGRPLIVGAKLKEAEPVEVKEQNG